MDYVQIQFQIIAEPHLNKKYKGKVYNEEGLPEYEIIIIPKSDNYIEGFANLVNESFEVQALKMKIEKCFVTKHSYTKSKIVSKSFKFIKFKSQI